MPVIIGIDMGTTNSAVAYADADDEQCIARILGPEGNPTVSSTVHLENGEFVAGDHNSAQPTQTQLSTDSNESFPAIKRLLGRKAHATEVTSLSRSVPYGVAASPTGDCWVRVGGRATPPQELAGALLRSLKRRAEDALDEPITRAVLAVPAYFDDTQRQAIRDAGHIAGLEVVRLINEPTAAALAYGVSGRSATIAVFDLGGGTFDVSILVVENDVFTVLASHGDASLGGDDWDRRIFDLLVDDIFSSHRFDATTDKASRTELRNAAEAAKQRLSTAEATTITATLTTPAGERIEVSRELSREEFESETADLCARLAPPCKLALSDAGLDATGIDEVLLVGGMTNMPMVRRAVAEFLGEPTTSSIDPATAVARGAAICGAIIAGSVEPTTLLDVSAHSLSVRVGNVEMQAVLQRGGELPARRVLRLDVESRGDLTVELYRGEHDELDENTLVGRVNLELANSGMVDLTIGIDVNSMVSVSAVDVASGASAVGRLRTPGALSESQLVRLVGTDGV